MKIVTAGWIQRPQEDKKEAKVRGNANGSSTFQTSVHWPLYLTVGEGVRVDN